MIKYTFNLKNNSNNKHSYNNSEYELKSIIANNIANKYSWLSAPASYTYTTTTYKKPMFFNLDTIDYIKAINILDDYAAKKYNKQYLTFSDSIDEYDFEIDGTPVRIFDDMIQIGYHMISRNMPNSYYINLSPEIKKIIIDITIKIYK